MKEWFGLGWGYPLPSAVLSDWRELAGDLSGLSDFHFFRKALDARQPGDMYLFCDASMEAYAFAAYIVQNHRSSLVFAKAKVAPMKDKTACFGDNGCSPRFQVPSNNPGQL